MTYKMLVLDIDDTLLNSDQEISPKTYDRLMAFQEAGFQLVLASGRPYEGMISLAKELHLHSYNSYIISMNGAQVNRMQDQAIIFKQPINFEDQKAFIPFLQEKGFSVLTYHEGKIIVDKVSTYSHVESELTGMSDYIDPDYFKNLQEAKLKFIAVGEPDLVNTVEMDLQQHFGQETTCTSSKPFYLEFYNSKVSKGLAVQTLANKLGYGIDQVIAMGDGNNDISMIQAAGLGVAMANASAALKAVADEVTLSSDEDGVAAIVDKYFLNK
ncbi:Cof-type HAD-IIB family hydrolase [Eremococcus coleocola]|uniref:Cof-type HAD-IIB family hydrolase n=1 Tax=Eremococcus coleocola TaxID=88132 RepID=UPI000400A777|nr:Cof-type HAD-IIB family hydrolase [Eremococcus coleocola]